MIEITPDLPADLVPLSWLLGVWEGTGVIEYDAGEEEIRGTFSHRVSFSHDGGPHLNYAATATLLTEDGTAPLVAETGFWRLQRQAGPGDPGPALLPPSAAVAPRTAEDVETLRTPNGGFPLEVSLAHSDGALELYLGEIIGPRITLASDAIVRSAAGRPYAAASRMYGLVNGELFWAWDIAALGASLASHASAQLKRV